LLDAPREVAVSAWLTRANFGREKSGDGPTPAFALLVFLIELEVQIVPLNKVKQASHFRLTILVFRVKVMGSSSRAQR
jgi:hypothetical protein